MKVKYIKKAGIISVVFILCMVTTTLAQNAIFQPADNQEEKLEETEENTEDETSGYNAVDETFVGAYSEKEIVLENGNNTPISDSEAAKESDTKYADEKTRKKIEKKYKRILNESNEVAINEMSEEYYPTITISDPVYNVVNASSVPGLNSGMVSEKDPTYSQKEFIEKIGSAAIEYWDEYQLLPSVTIAQAIIESRWGKSSLGRNYHNYFGIKYTSGCGTDYVTLKTVEQKKNGQYYNIYAKFRSYPTIEEGIKDRYKFLSENDRYSNLKGVTDYKTECVLLQQDGYATSLSYAQTLVDTIEAYGLQKYDNLAIKGN